MITQILRNQLFNNTMAQN